MKKLLFAFALLMSAYSFACSPCGALSNVTQNLNGNNLELTFTSNAGWQCCYNVNIEIVCVDAAFTGVANFLSPQICINGGGASSSTWSTPVPYPLTVIDLSSYCPGTYKWRAWEVPCNIFTPEFTFTIAGSNPLQVTSSASANILCLGENSQLNATAQNGCNGPYSYQWSPSTGLSNAYIANPIATPTSTTTYTLTVTEPGSCAATQTSSQTITVNPLPTASITDNVALCPGDPSPELIITGSGSTGPYTMNYSINGIPQPPVTTANDVFYLYPPTGTSGFYDYQLIDVTDSSPTSCSQDQDTYVTVTIWDPPVISAGEDIDICEPSGSNPTQVTLYGNGGVSYSWDNGVTNGVPFAPATGINLYTVTGTDFNGCTDTDEVTVTAFPLPVAGATASPVYANAPTSVSFTNTSQGANDYTWNYGNGTAPYNTTSSYGVSSEYNTPGIYTITILASNGLCFDTYDLQIEIIPPMVVTPPNIFTPNGDGSNEEYFVNVLYGDQFEAVIINRWGNAVHELHSINEGWDGKINGKDADEGVYYVKYTATDFNGNSVEGHTYFHLVR
jgi:gliding motility-associated-like protein